MITELTGQKLIEILFEHISFDGKRSHGRLEKALDAFNIAGNIYIDDSDRTVLSRELRDDEELCQMADVLQHLGLVSDWGINQEGLVFWV